MVAALSMGAVVALDTSVANAAASTVTFDANNGTGSMSPQTASVSTALTANTFTRLCNNFNGWNTVANGSGTAYANGASYPFTSSATLYAQWVSAGNVVVFNANSGSGAITPQCSFTPLALTANTITRAGYVFSGWNTVIDGSGTSYADQATFAFNSGIPTTLYAQWTPAASRTVTFDANLGTGSMSSQSANQSTALSANTFTRTGYGFSGWNTAANGSGTSYAAGANFPFTTDTTLYAQWTLNTYSVTFNSNSGSGSMSAQTFTHGVSANLTANSFTRSNYYFTGWNTAANGSGTAYSAGVAYTFTASTTLYAQWTNQVTATFDPNSGIGTMATQAFTMGSASTINANTFTRSGYMFTGWNTQAAGGGTAYYDQGSATFTNSSITTTLYAQWVQIPSGQAGVVFVANGGSGTMTAQVAAPSTALQANTFTAPSGKAFKGWNTAANGTGTAYAPGQVYAFASNVTLYAQWGYQVTFNGNGSTGGSMSPQIDFVSATSLNANAFTKTGYVFAGWTTSATLNGTTSPVYSDGQSLTLTSATTLYAQWAPGTAGQIGLIFLGNNGSVPGTGAVVAYQASGTSASLTANPFTQSGYTFKGWATTSGGSAAYADQATYDFVTTKTLYAVWAVNQVSFDANGGTGTLSAQSTSTDAQLSTNTFTRSGYVFSGWNTSPDGTGVGYGQNQTYGFSGSNATTKLYAQWTAVPSGSVAVSFLGNNATSGSMSPQIAASSTALTANAFTRSGYSFGGWNTQAGGGGTSYTDTQAYSFGSTLNLYAQWKPIVTYTPGYAGGSADVTQVVTNTSSHSLLALMYSRSGYVFEGWKDGSGTWYLNGQTGISSITSPTTLTAQWIAVTASQHLVTFWPYSSSGTPTTQVSSTSAALTTAPTISKRTFLGWATSSGGSVVYLDKATYSFSADVVLFPVTQANIVTFDANGGSGTMSTQTSTSQSNLTSNSFTFSGFTFNGWNTKADGTGTSYSNRAQYNFNSSNMTATLYAQWTPTGLSVTYNANGGAGTMAAQSGTSGTSVTFSPNMFTNSGKAFTGWNTLANGTGTSYADGETLTITANVTLYAQWVVLAPHQVTFDANGGSGSMSAVTTATGSTVLPAGAFTKTNAIFYGWNTAANNSGTSYADQSQIPVLTDVLLYAQYINYDPSYVSISFNPNGGSGTPVTPLVGAPSTTTTAPANPFSRASYIFGGWNTAADGSGTNYSVGSSLTFPAVSTTLYAKWTQTWFTVTFDPNGGSGTMATQTASTATNLSSNAFTRTNYVFNGWNTAANGSGTSYSNAASFPFTSNRTLYAQWTQTAFTVTFDANGGVGTMLDQTAATSTPLQANTYTRDGYVFAGWNTLANGTGTSYANGASYGFTANLTLYARWTAIYTVTFDANGGTGTMSTQTGNTATPLNVSAFTKTSYAFSGWNTAADGSGTTYLDGATYAFTASVTLYAKWTLITWPIVFDPNGGSGTMSTGHLVGPSTLPANTYTRSGYTFLGWAGTTGVPTATYGNQGSINVTAPLTLYAVWSPDSHTLTYDSQGGSSVSPQTFVTDETIVVAADPTRAGYTFTGWFTTASGGSSVGATYTPLLPVDVTLYAQWTANSYTVTYDTQGGSAVSSGSYTWGGSVTLPSAPTRSGYTFTGWFTGASGGSALGATYTPGTPADLTLYAQWTAITYSVTYVDNGATTAHSGGASTYSTGSSFTLPTAPARNGYTFAGWELTGTNATTASITSSATSATPAGYGNVTLTAQWTAVSNTVTYVDNGATTAHAGGASSYNTGSSFTLPTVPLRSGYTFGGWQLTGTNATTATITSSATSATPAGYGNITLTAQWTTISYTVTYVDNGATTAHVGGDATYTTGSSFTLPTAPARSGYTFTGWQLTGTNATTASIASSASSATPAGYGNVTLTAQWSTGANVVTYDDNGATTSHSGGDNSYNTGSSFNLPVAPSRSGYTFGGWQLTGANATTASVVSSATTATPVGFGNVTLTAQWTAISFTVTYVDNGATTAHVGGDATYTTGSAFDLPTTAPARNGYSFAGWQLTGSHATTASLTVEDTTALPAGYGNVTLTARWTAVANTVTYDDNGATANHSGGATTYTTGASFSLPTPPARSGYTFGGWRLTGSHVTTATLSAPATSATPSGYGDVTLTAQWTAITYSVTYLDNGATTAHSGGAATYATGSSFVLPTAPSRNGYTFGGWQLTGTNATTAAIASSATSATPAGFGNVTLTAQWTAISYTVTYVDNGATTAHDGGDPTYTTDGTFTLPTAPARSGYTFGGWTLTGVHATTATLSPDAETATPVGYGDLTLTAEWSSGDNIVTYVDNGATAAHVGGDGSYVVGESFALPTPPSRTGYTFAGWQLTGTNVTTELIEVAATSATPDGYGNVTLTAQWTPLTFVIQYNPNGGSGLLGDVNYTVGGPTLSAASGGAFARTGYTFLSWNTSPNGTGTTILPGSTFLVTGNTVLYAVWQFVPTPVVTPPTTPTRPATPSTTSPASPSAAPIVVSPQRTPQGRPLAEPLVGSTLGNGSRTETIDVGDGPTSRGSGLTPLAAATNDSAKRSLSDMQSEEIGGFSQGSSVVIKVSGSRTAGQFLVTDSGVIDTFAVAAALEESVPRKSADFAKIDDVSAVTSVDWSKVTTGTLTTDALDLFKASGLGVPRTLANVSAKTATHWVEVKANAAGYVPGSVVYLAVTTEPLIFGSAQVDANGTVVLDGMLPIDVLEPAAHNIRIVGTRDLGGVTVNSDGTIALSDSTMEQIQRFDRGTNAVVELSGKGVDGLHAAVRLVPLTPTIPWWLLWYLIGGLMVLLAIRQWKFRSRFAPVALWSTAIAGVTAIEIVAWIEEAYVMLPWVAVAAGVILGLDVVISIFRRHQASSAEVPGNSRSQRRGLSASYSKA
jgi:uncharacterized repeat protein (TIGR02543 family)